MLPNSLKSFDEVELKLSVKNGHNDGIQNLVSAQICRLGYVFNYKTNAKNRSFPIGFISKLFARCF